ncbi:phage/plasmid primase, P4 family [Alphaproteobacteria bacterium]|nr:phage/plasmid primase, P4 family [Alphaproteobacteria bacterium]
MVGEIHIMIIEEECPTSVGQEYDGAIAELRIMRRPENVSEANLAQVFAAYLQGKALHCFDDKHWYLWNGQRSQKDKQNQITLNAEAFVQLAAKMVIDEGEPDIARRILGFMSAQKLDNLVKLAKPRLAVNLTDFDSDPMQLCVGNGVIDLATGKLLEPNPAMRHSKMAGVSYDAQASCPRFMQFLKDIFPDDPELLEYAQKVAGYILTGSTKEQCLFMLLGGGANGKSTLVSLLTKLMGDYAANTAASTLMASSNNQLGDDLIRLAGARLVTAAETEHGQRFAEAKIKSFTGGDMISARPLYGEWVDFKPVGKILLTTNNRPEIRGSDDGIWRRIREIPFNRQFTEAEQDKELMTTLTQELPGILNWAIEGCLLWQANGLSAPASVTASVSEYRSEMDTVCSFIVDECTVAAHERIPIGNLYEQYVSWCRSSGKHPRSKVQFGKALTSQGYEQIRGSTGRYWRGLSISITG